MGANLSLVWPDRSADVISPADAFAEMFLALAWLGSFYGIGMIFTTAKLVDRWRGPRDDNPTSLGTVMAAVLLSVAWPLVLVGLAVSSYN